MLDIRHTAALSRKADLAKRDSILGYGYVFIARDQRKRECEVNGRLFDTKTARNVDIYVICGKAIAESFSKTASINAKRLKSMPWLVRFGDG